MRYLSQRSLLLWYLSQRCLLLRYLSYRNLRNLLAWELNLFYNWLHSLLNRLLSRFNNNLANLFNQLLRLIDICLNLLLNWLLNLFSDRLRLLLSLLNYLDGCLLFLFNNFLLYLLNYLLDYFFLLIHLQRLLNSRFNSLLSNRHNINCFSLIYLNWLSLIKIHLSMTNWHWLRLDICLIFNQLRFWILFNLFCLIDTDWFIHFNRLTNCKYLNGLGGSRFLNRLSKFLLNLAGFQII